MTADPVVEHLGFTVEQFERMGDAGVLDPDERYELLWIVGLDAELVHVHRDRVDDTDRTVTAAGRGDRVSPVDFPDVELTVEELPG